MKGFCSVLALAAAALAIASPASATLLTFDNTNCTSVCGNGSYFLQSYGDTADVDVSYRSLDGQGNASVYDATGLKYWDTSYGDLTDVAWGGANDSFGVPEITFTVTTPGKIVTLNSFDYAGWPLIDKSSSIRVYDLSYNLLLDTGAITFPGTGHGHQTVNLSSSTGLRLQWGPSGYNAGIDNLSFNGGDPRGVPEPANWAMMIAGFGLVGATMRRSRHVKALA